MAYEAEEDSVCRRSVTLVYYTGKWELFGTAFAAKTSFMRRFLSRVVLAASVRSSHCRLLVF